MDELMGHIGGLLTTVSMVPQVWRLFKLKSAHEISLMFSLTLTFGIFFWLYYGVMNDYVSVIVWNSITFVLCVMLLYAKLKWGIYYD
jgi:MtN3 and saliva related transmembrane protein